MLCLYLVCCTSVSAIFRGLSLLFFSLVFVLGLDNSMRLRFEVGDTVFIIWLGSFVGRVRVV